MGYAVLHMEKASGTDSAMSSHIERTIEPKNADKNRTHLNQELIEFPDGVQSRTEAIQHRLDTAGLKRKIGKNQVRAIRILLTGSPDDMKRIEKEGKLNTWCHDNLKWLGDTYGADNIVSAVLHLDETTPHIHATLVPIVTGERRKAKKEQEQQTGKKYKKKNSNAPRLCADDVMSRIKLKEYQNTYAEQMAKYGLQRGIEGSEAKHVSTSQYYRDLIETTRTVKSDVAKLQEQKEQAKQELSQVKGEINSEKLKGIAVNVGTTLMEGASSFLGTSKVRKQTMHIEQLEAMLDKAHDDNIKLQQQNKAKEVERQKEMDDFVRTAQNEITNMNNIFQQKKIELQTEIDSYESRLQKVLRWFPVVGEYLRIEKLCKAIGLAKEHISALLSNKTILYTGDLYSEEHKRKFTTQNSQIHIDKGDKKKFLLTIDNKNHSNWFKDKWDEIKQSVNIRNTNNRSRGFRM